MAKEMKNLSEAEINANASFFDAEIIPNVYYQVYGFDKVFCHDDEGVNYLFNNENKTTISIQVVTEVEKTYYKVGALEFDTETNPDSAPENGILVDSLSTVPDNAKVGEIYYTDEVNEEVHTYTAAVVKASLTSTTNEADLVANKGEIYSTSSAPKGSVENDVFYYNVETLLPAQETAVDPYEYNKYGKIKPNTKIYVSLTLSSLKNTYTGATITIDGKDYDLGIADNPIVFNMNKDHRIQINWVYGNIVETFRIVCNR